jgi:hypothetical protein
MFPGDLDHKDRSSTTRREWTQYWSVCLFSSFPFDVSKKERKKEKEKKE